MVELNNWVASNFGGTTGDLLNLRYTLSVRIAMPLYADMSSMIDFVNSYINAPGDGGGGCFSSDTMVTLYDGSTIQIKDIKVGDKVIGGYGYINDVIGIDKYKVTPTNCKMYIINGSHITSDNHRHWTQNGWAAIRSSHWSKDKLINCRIPVIVDNIGTVSSMPLLNMQKDDPTTLEIGSVLVTDTNQEPIVSIEKIPEYQEEYIYSLITTGSHTHLANGKIVSGWAHDQDFDYDTWKVKEK
jgi:hypothetical protein